MCRCVVRNHPRTKTEAPSVNTEALVEFLSTESDYRAVAPDAKSGLDTAGRRRQMIQESKFLGDGMEHKYLVKSLD
ncbi:hypothetical protein NPIL_516351 [Nephila pilipes]|uniref:RED-like N-terminal domain-containing protein n=1 Tax=Nephila pilipes TaxID=299642 RepID=A0A8X6T5F8_NEPPI|nr:hypothetical protein NPIL_303321 [Nephila pilipes]GFT68644.1 hypothetical protein NPIL_516351 [Nephila pilipes]